MYLKGTLLVFLFSLIWPSGVLFEVPFGPGVVLLARFVWFFLGLGASCGVPGQQQLKDASQLAGLELGRNSAGVPAAAKRR